MLCGGCIDHRVVVVGDDDVSHRRCVFVSVCMHVCMDVCVRVGHSHVRVADDDGDDICVRL